jgi:predicted small secreted protein
MMNKTLIVLLCALAACLAAGCGTPSGPGAAGAARSGGSSGIEVFGTIDAGVSHTTTRSGR